MRVLPTRFLYVTGMLLLAASAVPGQGVTTGSVNGVVTVEGAPSSGTTVTATHVTSGTKYTAQVRNDGHYTIPAMRVGGPYVIAARRIGYQQQEQDSVYVTLGETSEVDLDLKPAAVQLQGVNVTASTASIMGSEHTGAATTVTREMLYNLPSISGRLESIIRLTPQSNGSYSFVGQDSRFNNITVDGSYFNNSFGLGNAPGDRTGVAPISLDAIEQVQVDVAPFDVRQGNFVGASVNTVTRSGTNDLHGSLRLQGRNQSMIGTKAGASPFNPGTSKYQNLGGWVSGPIVRNRAFYFFDFESDGVTQPATTFTANTGGQPVQGNTTRVLASDLDSLAHFLEKNFNYNPGAYQGYNAKTPSTRYLGKLDFNLSDSHKLSLRYDQLGSNTDVLLSNSSSLGFGSRRSNSTGLNYQDANYKILENIQSFVGELNSTLRSNLPTASSPASPIRTRAEARRAATSRARGFPLSIS